MNQAICKKRILLDLLSQLSNNADNHLTVYQKPSSFPFQVDSLSKELKELAPELIELLSNDQVLQEAGKRETGLAIFWDQNGNKLIILPPFPIQEDKVFFGRPDLSPLKILLEKERIIGIMLINWGSYAAGIFNTEKLTESKAGTGYIQKKVKKGGSSQKRYSRRTEEQKKHFLRRVANHIEEVFKPSLPEVIFYGGNRLILKPLLKESDFLEAQAQKISPRLINLRYADREALLKSLDEANESMVFSF